MQLQQCRVDLIPGITTGHRSIVAADDVFCLLREATKRLLMMVGESVL